MERVKEVVLFVALVTVCTSYVEAQGSVFKTIIKNGTGNFYY